MSFLRTPFQKALFYSSIAGIGIFAYDEAFNSNKLRTMINTQSNAFIGTNIFTSSSNPDQSKFMHSRFRNKQINKRKEDKSKRPKVGLGCLILRENKDDKELEFLVGIRKSSHGEGLYQLPGGHLEYGESWQECANKEVMEETNLNIPADQWRFVFINNSIAPAKNKDDENLHYIDIIMSSVYNGDDEVVNNEPNKCEGWQWVKWNNHGLDNDRLFCGLKAILTANDFNPNNDFAKFVSYDQWKVINES